MPFEIAAGSSSGSVIPQSYFDGLGWWPELAEDFPETLPDGRPWPKISVVTPCYNAVDFIEQTVVSVLAQHYPNLEYIVMDGGSNDGTQEVVNRYSEHLTLISEPDKGQSDALNKGFARATGTILSWINGDDMLAPGALFRVALAFSLNDADMVAGEVALFRDDRFIKQHATAATPGPLPLNDLLDLDGGWNAGLFFYQPEVFFTRDIYDSAGGRIDTTLHYSMDFDLWVRMAQAGARIHPIGGEIAWFRIHEEQKTADVAAFRRELAEYREQFLKTFPDTPAQAPKYKISGRRPRIAVLNDIGFLYGAGIAQSRICDAFGLGDIDAVPIRFRDDVTGPGPMISYDIGQLADLLEDENIDAIVLGNIHAARFAVEDLEQIVERWPVFVVTHDLFWLTGRCAYVGDCADYLQGCTADCPTSLEYPLRPVGWIAREHEAKRRLIANPNFRFLTQSQWVHDVVAEYLEKRLDAKPDDIADKLYRIDMPVPEHQFHPIRDRASLRKRWGIPEDAFVIMTAAASVEDRRKNIDDLARVIGPLAKDVYLLLLGRSGSGYVPFPNHRFLEYLDDPAEINEAYNLADVYIALAKAETFGQTYAEAAMAGVPSIGYDATGVATSVVEGGTGWRLPAGDVAAVRDLLRSLIDDRERAANMGRTAAFVARNRFSRSSFYKSFFRTLQASGLVTANELIQKVNLSRTATAKPVMRGIDEVFSLAAMRAVGRTVETAGPDADGIAMDAVEAHAAGAIDASLGWSRVEGRHVWSVNRRAGIVAAVSDTRRDHVLRLIYASHPLLCDAGASISVRVNGHLMAEAPASGWKARDLVLSPDVLGDGLDGMLLVTLEASQRTTRQGKDARSLYFALARFELRPKEV